MPQVTVAQRTDEWLQARIGKIGASNAAACLGLDPYKSARKAWREIMGIGVTLVNRHMQWGVTFEPAAKLDYESATGNMIEETGLWQHPELPWLCASPDGLIGSDGGLECKCPMRRPERLVLHHRIQILISLYVTGRSWWDYWSWPAPPQEPFLCRVYASRGTEGLVRRLEAFYRTFILTGVEPPRKKPRRKK